MIAKEEINLKLNKIHIIWKIFLILLGYCTLLIFLLWLFQIVFLDDFYKNIKISQIENVADKVVRNIDSNDLQEIIDQISSNNDMCIEVLTPDGMRLNISNFDGDNILHRMRVDQKVVQFAKTEKNGGTLLEYFSLTTFNKIRNGAFNGRLNDDEKSINDNIIYSRIVSDKNNSSRIILFNALISPVNATVQTLRIQLYYITGIMLLFSLLFAFAIAKWISKPIVKINNSAKELAKGNYKVNFNGSGYKEISELSDTLNYTANELSKVDVLNRELIANISHDFRTPLTLIAGYSEAMRDLPCENTPENLQIIIDEAKRLSSLVNDVLDISKIQSGTQKLNLSFFNITKIIQQTIGRFSKLCEQDGYTIKFIFDKEIYVSVDELRISQVLYNLLNNAINYSGIDKTVIIKQTSTNSVVKIEVIDTGEGIEEDKLQYIWERYYKADKVHKKAVLGTGLGLSIVKSILDMHKDTKYGVVSEVGVGSTFWFSLKI